MPIYGAFGSMTAGVGYTTLGMAQADQTRVDTPANAIKAGARYIVVGREFTTATDPASALENIINQLGSF